MQVMLCSGVLPKPMPGSSTILSRAMPARSAISSERAKNADTSAMMSMAGSAVSRLCMTITGTPRSATSVAMSGSRCRPQTSLTIAAPWSSAQAATLALMVSIDTGRPSLTTAGSTGAEPRHFVVAGDRLRAAIGPRRLRADVENVGALFGHRGGVGDGRRRIDELAAVGKRIRGDVEDAHDQRPAERQQRGKRVARGLLRWFSGGFEGAGEPHGGRFARRREAVKQARNRGGYL